MAHPGFELLLTHHANTDVLREGSLYQLAVKSSAQKVRPKILEALADMKHHFETRRDEEHKVRPMLSENLVLDPRITYVISKYPNKRLRESPTELLRCVDKRVRIRQDSGTFFSDLDCLG
jgi:hypothetical protein